MNTPVKVIFSKGNVSVVEFDRFGVPNRVVVNEKLIHSDPLKTEFFVADEDLDQGIPYGTPIASILGSVTLTGEDIENEFHKNGLWTDQDIVSNSSAVLSSIQGAFKLTYSTIIQAIFRSTHKEV